MFTETKYVYSLKISLASIQTTFAILYVINSHWPIAYSKRPSLPHCAQKHFIALSREAKQPPHMATNKHVDHEVFKYSFERQSS